LPAAFSVIVLIPVLVVIAYLVRDQLQAQHNRLYKTLAEHEILNNAGDRSAWMSGIIPQQGDEEVDRFTSRVVPITQLVMLFVLIGVVLRWNSTLVDQGARRDERIAQLELQVHALAFATPTDGTSMAKDSDGSPAPAQIQVAGNPMQQACANLIGRVADAYEKAESSKIALSLEQLVNKLGCKNSPAP
jgi:hypothetical protein